MLQNNIFLTDLECFLEKVEQFLIITGIQKWIQDIRGYIVRVNICRKFSLLIYWSAGSSSRRGGDGVKRVDGGYRYLIQRQTLEDIKIWCNIQVLIYRFMQTTFSIFQVTQGAMPEYMIFPQKALVHVVPKKVIIIYFLVFIRIRWIGTGSHPYEKTMSSTVL